MALQASKTRERLQSHDRREWSCNTLRDELRLIRQEQLANLGHRLLFPVLIEVFHSHKGSRVHAVDVERALEMIDFMLEDAGIPAAGFDYFRLALMVETIDADLPGTRYGRGEASQAETAFEEVDTFISESDSRIDDHVKWNWPSFALLESLRISFLNVLRLIFNNRNLQSLPDLRCRQSNARRFIHGLPHTLDETLNFAAPNFGDAQASSLLPQNWLTYLNNIE